MEQESASGQVLTFTNDSFGGVKMGHPPIGLILQSSFRDRVIFPQISRQLLPELKSLLSQNMERLNLYSFSRPRRYPHRTLRY